MLSVGTSNDAGDCAVGGRQDEVSVVVGGAFESGWCHTMVRSRLLGI